MANPIERPPGTPCERCGERDAITPEWTGAAWCGPCLNEQLSRQIHAELTNPNRFRLIGSRPHPQEPSLPQDIIEIDRNAVAFVPQIDPDWSPDLHYAMTIARSADLETSCPLCGGPTPWKGRAEERPVVWQGRMVMACCHIGDCPADEALVLEQFRRWKQTR
jgi:hypothetical protein